MKSSLLKCAFVLISGMALSACNTVSNLINPFYEPPKPVALLGEMNDHALNESKGQGDTARQALDAMATYKRAQDPQPYNPVMQPAIVRLMWVPDHLNKSGDLVPAHYYYLKVKAEAWAVNDAFELDQQNNGPHAHSNDNTALPYVNVDDKLDN